MLKQIDGHAHGQTNGQITCKSSDNLWPEELVIRGKYYRQTMLFDYERDIVIFIQHFNLL